MLHMDGPSGAQQPIGGQRRLASARHVVKVAWMRGVADDEIDVMSRPGGWVYMI